MALRYAVTSLVLVSVFLFCSDVWAADVVLLHGTDAATPWGGALAEGLSRELDGEADVVSILLGSDVHGDDYFDERFEFLLAKWQGRVPVAVVADGEVAFAFMRKYGEALFAGVPIVYCGMSRPDSEYLSQCGDCVGIPLEYPVEETVDLIFDLQPETSMVVGIMDGSSRSLQLRRALEDAMEPYADRAQLLFPGHEPGDDEGLNMAGLASVASSVARADSVLFLGFSRDNAGESVDEAEAVQLLTTRSDGPVYVLSDHWLGQGVLGGVSVSGNAQGRDVGRMIRRIMAGEPTQEMLPEVTSPVSSVDLTVMAMRGIPTDRLPPDTVGVHAPSLPEGDAPLMPTGVVILGSVLLAGAVLLFFVRRSAGRRDM